MEFSAFDNVRERIDRSARAVGSNVRLLAVSKRQPDTAVRALATQGQRAFGENYAQALRIRRDAIRDCRLEWHLIGALQSNKSRLAAAHADWVQSIDRTEVIRELARHRPLHLPILDVLVQVNIDDEDSKSGCEPRAAATLCAAVAAESRLRLRGLMVIPRASIDTDDRRASFARTRLLFDDLHREFDSFDTLSMGMSEDFELAIAEGSTMVRVGTALFGPRQTTIPS